MKLTDLREILQYIPQFREKTFILAVDGGVVTDENFANILLDLAVLRSLNIRVVIVHGAAEQIKSTAQALDGVFHALADPTRRPILRTRYGVPRSRHKRVLTRP